MAHICSSRGSGVRLPPGNWRIQFMIHRTGRAMSVQRPRQRPGSPMHQEHTRVPSSQITRGTCPHKDRQETTMSPRLKGQKFPHNRVRLSQRAPRADAGAHVFFTFDASSLARSCKTHPFGFPEVRWGCAVSSQKGEMVKIGVC